MASAAPLTDRLAAELEDDRARAGTDPFTNAFLLFALRLGRGLTAGDFDLEGVEAAVSALAAEAFAARLGRYLGDCDPIRLGEGLDALFEAVAADGDFHAFAAAVEAVPFGIVLTAHPTFALSMELSRNLVELATGRDGDGRALSAQARAARFAEAGRLPPGPPG